MGTKTKEFILAVAGLILSPVFFYLFSSEGQSVLDGAWWWAAVIVWALLCGGALAPFVMHQILDLLAPLRRISIPGQKQRRDYRPLIILVLVFLMSNGFAAFIVYGHMVEKIQRTASSGSPEDAATIWTITTERVNAEKKRDEWKEKYDDEHAALLKTQSELKRNIDEIASLNDTITAMREDRAERIKLSDEMATWMVRIAEFRGKLSWEKGALPPIEDFQVLKNEFMKFAAENLRPAQRELLKSTAGINLPLYEINFKEQPMRDFFRESFLWEQRLQDFRHELD